MAVENPAFFLLRLAHRHDHVGALFDAIYGIKWMDITVIGTLSLEDCIWVQWPVKSEFIRLIVDSCGMALYKKNV